MSFCKSCNDVTETLYSDSRGETYCTRCGAVLEENRIVEAVTFTESSSGAVRATGQFIPSSGFGTAPSGFAASYGSRESREHALQRGYANIQRIADRLHLALPIVEAAQRIYLMGVQRNFTMGRVTSHVAAACLYTSCRREKASQMLIDFSDILCTPVRTLGRVFVKLIRVLRINVPTIDPSLFMERFASQMPLEGKTQVVAQTGVRLVQAMTRDWICTGRRPTGLCGAALLIAARFHGFKINPRDISAVIRMSSSTVNKRLNEFRHTSVAQLKAGEFETADLLSLPILRGPPCVEHPRTGRLTPALPQAGDIPELELPQGEELLQLPDKPEVIETLDRQNTDDDNRIDDAAEREPFQAFRAIQPLSIEATEDEICVPNPSSSTIAFLADRLVSAIEHQVIRTDFVHGGAGGTTSHTLMDGTVDSALDVKDQEDIEDDPLRALLLEVKDKASELVAREDSDGDTSSQVAKPFRSDVSESIGPLVPFDHKQEDLDVYPQAGNHIVPAQGFEEDESLSDVSDTEIDALLLSEDERRAKALIWDELMKDVMPEIHRRLKVQKRREELEQGGALKRLKRQGGNSGMRELSDAEMAVSPAASVRMGLEAKNPGFAKRLNDSTLNALFSVDYAPIGGRSAFEKQEDIAPGGVFSPQSASLASLFV